MENVEQTIISQYATSPTIVRLIQNMDGYLDPRADIDAFYNLIWNVDTAVGFGLDIWGKIVGIGRTLTIPGAVAYFGFYTGVADTQPFGQAPFYNGGQATQTYVLSDDAYRVLILVKALANISETTSPAINQLLKNLFGARGRAYVLDIGQMTMRYVFEFYLQPFEVAIIAQSNALPHPAGVGVQIAQVDRSGTFGFSQAYDYAQPFNQGTFSNNGVTNAT